MYEKIAIMHGSLSLQKLRSKYMKHFAEIGRFKQIHYGKIKTRS